MPRKLDPGMLEALRVTRQNRAEHRDLGALCLASGFRSASMSEMRCTTGVAGVDQWWEMQWTHGIRTFLREFDDATLQKIKRDAGIRLGSLRNSDGTIPLTLTMSVCTAVK